MVGSAFPSFMLDRMGRRITLMWGTCMVGGSMMFIAILLSIGSKAASMACIAFFFTVRPPHNISLSRANADLLPVHHYLWRQSELCSLGISSRDLASGSEDKGRRGRHFVQLDLEFPRCYDHSK